MCGIAVAIDWPDAELTVRLLISGILHRGDVTDPIVYAAPRQRARHPAAANRRRRARHAAPDLVAMAGWRCPSTARSTIPRIAPGADRSRRPIPHQSDTEVLANALQAWGYRALERLNGMYAFVALDMASGEFLAARDPFGVKPLYVIQSKSGFCSARK